MKKSKKAEKQKVFFGIADCHGIESFIPEAEANIGILQVRASANFQRHAVVFKIACNKKEASNIKNILANGKDVDFVRALKVMKYWLSSDYASICSSMRNEVPLVEVTSKKLWDNIPNYKLDPFN